MASIKRFQLVKRIRSSVSFLGMVIIVCLSAGCTITVNHPPIPCGDTAALIAAIEDANLTNNSIDVIELEAGCIYTLLEPWSITEGATGLPYITTPIRINGNGAIIARRDDPAVEKFRIFFINPLGELELNDLTLENGYAYYPTNPNEIERNSGGAIRNNNKLVLNGVTIQHNNAHGATGGIFNEGEVAIENSTLRDNQQENLVGAIGAATAIFNRMGATTTMVASTVSGNGLNGIFYTITNAEDGFFSLTNSTISGNSGTAINNDGRLELLYVTIVGHDLGIWSVNYGIPKIEMTGTLFQNQADCNIGNNVVILNNSNMDSDGSCGVTYTVAPANQLLGGLADNGGPTETHALLPGSPAIDAVTGIMERVCPLDADQRGIARPQGSACDIGAYEYHPLTPVSTPNTNPGSVLPSVFTPTVTDTPIPTATFTPEPTATYTPSPEPQASRCELFDGAHAALTMHDIPYGTTNLTLYVQWPHPVWGLEEMVEGDEDDWVYGATLGATTATGCTYQGYSGRLYCNFMLPETAFGATLALKVYINGCLDPIFTHQQVSIFEPVPSCSAALPQQQCEDAGGAYNARESRCDCP